MNKEGQFNAKKKAIDTVARYGSVKWGQFLHEVALSAEFARLFFVNFVAFAHLAHQCVKCLVHVGAGLGAGLDVTWWNQMENEERKENGK